MESDSFKRTYISQEELDDTSTQQFFSRVNQNRQSIVKNLDNNPITIWSNQTAHKTTYNDQIFKIKLAKCAHKQEQALGIHVIPTYDLDSQKDMGLIIQRIEPTGRVSKDGRMRIGDRIVEINNSSLIGIDFKTAQKILRDAIQQSNELINIDLEFKIVRSKTADIESDSEINERPVEIDDLDDKENNTVIQTNSSFNNHSSSINMNALNTKKLGKIITVQLVKGPQGLGFKLAARDNCASGEFSPIYIKNILPKGAAITDGRLQRGDRLIEVDKLDMTKTTLHEAVNILRNTKLGTCVELVVSRQILPNLNNSQETPTNNEPTPLPREINDDNNNINEAEINQEPNNTINRRQLLTFEIALNDTGSAGLGVSVKGKTKRIEENDCSIDLGIFIKIVINGGAAFKDGRLRANDQLININGFSLLGKSNEEAMLILREAMQVESKPGHIQLTVSRKLKSTANESPIKSETLIKHEPTPPSPKQVVKVINHTHQSPIKQFKTLNSTPITTSSGRNKEETRFSRDAPSRRSMSEKRTKIGSNQMNKSQTANGINRFQRNSNQSSLIDTYSPKRTQTIVNSLIPNRTNASLIPQEYRTLNKNFKIKTHNQLKSKDLNTIISQESLLSNRKQVDTLKSNLEANRLGSFESVLSQTVTVSSIKSTSSLYRSTSHLSSIYSSLNSSHESLNNNNLITKKKVTIQNIKRKKFSKKKLKLNQQESKQPADKSNTKQHDYYLQYLKRICFIMLCKNKQKCPARSASFIDNNHQILINQSLLTPIDQIPSDYDDDLIAKNETYKLKTKTNKNLNTSNTIKEPQQQPRGPIQLNSNTHRRSISMETFQADQVTEFTVQQSNHQPNYNKFGTISGYSTTNNQFTNQIYLNPTNKTNLNKQQTVETTNIESAKSRFRAINRSFRTAVDKSFDMPTNSETSDDQCVKVDQIVNKNKGSVNKKSIIETFQSLFKNKNKNSKPEVIQINNSQSNGTIASTLTNEHFNANKQSNTIELLNYQKRNQDDHKNYIIKTTNSCDQIMNHNSNFEIPITTQLETLIDNNTLYTQYKPQSSSSTTNELSTATGISSSSSTSSASSTSASFIQQNNKTNLKSNFNVNNRRDCLFYHSSDNYRFNNYYQQQSNHVSRYRSNKIDLQSIPQEPNVVIKHAAPFNGSKQVHTVSDLFEENKVVDNTFDRYNLNQLSTKSQPAYDKRSIYPVNVSNSYQQHFNTHQAKIIQPHPANV